MDNNMKDKIYDIACWGFFLVITILIVMEFITP
jgi:hypothetical protein